MSKLKQQDRFFDLSDYGRPVAKVIAKSLINTSVTPVQVTGWFIVSGILAIFCMLEHWYWASAFFLVLKSILDGADGELARVKNTPSYTGRYFDSIADLILNFFFLFTIFYITSGSIWMTILAFIGMQLQGTLYNYYYVILRNNLKGDTTSRVFENEVPQAFPGESQKTVTVLFRIYKILYSGFDHFIYWLDKNAVQTKNFPKWFMTLISSFGLGFQLLLIGILLIAHLEAYIIPFFIGYSILIPVFILIRKLFLK